MRDRRDLVLLLGGAAVSTVGGSLTLLAVLVHLRPAGSGWVAAALAGELVPIVVLAPFVGRLVDRVPNRRLLLGAIVLQGGAVLLAAAGLASAPVVVGALVLLGVGTAVANPTTAALLPHVAGEEGSTRAYGWFSAITQAGFLVGFAVSGVLVEATSVRTALLLDAATYGVLALAILALRSERRPERSGSEVTESVWAGFAWIRTDRLLLVCVGGMAPAILATVIVNVAEVFYVLDDIGAGPAEYGLVTALWPAAGILGGWFAGRLVGESSMLRALAVATVVMGVGLAAAGAVVSLMAVAIGWLLGGAAGAVQRVAVTALTRARTPDEVRGRVFAASSAVFQAGNLVGLAIGAGLVEVVGARGTLLLAGAVTAVVGAGIWVAGRSAVRQTLTVDGRISRDADEEPARE